MSRLGRVETYAGFKGDERPMAFELDGTRQEVADILDRWYGEDHDYFKVRTADGASWLLRRDRRKDDWELIEGNG